MTEPARVSGSNIGRYQLGEELAAGGMATVHLARVVGPAGISRIVAVKRMHAHVANDPAARRMFLDEARLAYRISHPNVVGTLDVVEHEAEVLIVLEYVAGETLAKLQQTLANAGKRIELPVLSAIIVGALRGLHAAHEALDERGQPVQVVHRDVSPQNLIVGVDGVTRVLDFGIAKARGRLQETTGIAVRGKLRYLSPEQIRRTPVDRRADLFATGVVLWEALVGRRLFDADDMAGVLDAVLHGEIEAPHQLVPHVPRALSELLLRVLSRNPEERPPTALAFADELAAIVPPAAALEVSAMVKTCAAPELSRRQALVARLVAGSELAVARSPAGRRSVTAGPPDPDATEPEVEASRPSSAAAAPATPDLLGSRRRVRLSAGLLALTLALAGGAFALTRKGSSPVATAPSGAKATAITQPTSAPVAEPTVSAVEAAEASAPSTAASTGKTTMHGGPRKAPRPSPAPSFVPSPRPRPAVDKGCEFPFVIGEGGVRIPKKACFGP